ncbi:MAG: quinoprotein dehydrogenase-associated putative ABC transporter substrate-binding protein [Methylococcaceae bacterium]|nr:quinoprotein dehydrogenase-associated putative ABC transporter substrate-binding protein [Methylococcaceae bacterium]
MKFNHRLVTMISALLLSATSYTAAADKFKVCADPLNPPYSTKKLDGFENKIAALFAEKLGQEVEYTWFPQRIGFIRNTLRVELEDGSGEYKCDVVMGVPAGYELTLTTQPYYHSQYVMLIAKGRGFDEISSPEQISVLPLVKQEQLKIAMFDRGPGTTWLQQQGLLDQGVPYQTMTGDDENNVAMTIEKDLKAKKIDMAIVWGPMAGYILSQSPKESYIALPMQSTKAVKYDFSMAMGVRYGDKQRKVVLDKLIVENQMQINEIIKSYQIPLLPIPAQKPHDDDD